MVESGFQYELRRKYPMPEINMFLPEIIKKNFKRGLELAQVAKKVLIK